MWQWGNIFIFMALAVNVLIFVAIVAELMVG